METTTKKLRPGQRYLFYEKKPYEENETIFRANFLALYERTQTLIINNSETERDGNTKVSIPLGWITKIETLEDITNGKIILPQEMLWMIDEYL
jgi:hypothetical protein